MPVTIEQDLKDILAQINQKLDRLQKDTASLTVSVGKIETKLDDIDKRFEKVENPQRSQIWALIGILGSAVMGILAAGGRLLWMGKSL